MKQFIISALSLTLALPLSASAATFVVSPSSGSYHVGDTVTLYVSVNPGGDTIYTAMMDARVSSSIFDIVSFSLNDALLPLKQSGYDALDRTQGILTKTGGYTGGITTTSTFGTIVLRAKAAGTGTFSIVDSSKLLDSNNADKQSGTQTFSFAVASKPVAIAPTQTAPKTTVASPAKPKPEAAPAAAPEAVNGPVIAVATDSGQTTASGTPQVATAAGSGISFMTILSWIVSLLVALTLGYALGTRRNTTP